jgi:hypothetical protein
MFKKVFIALAAMSLLLPSAMPTQALAQSGSWSQLQATAAWVYDDYKVERLDFSKTIYGGPMSMGDSVIVAKVSGQCDYVANCERYDLYAFKNGMTMFLGNVPRDVVNEQEFLSNGEDLVYANSSENGTRWSVVDLSLETGEENILIEDVFIDGVQDMKVIKDGENYFFNPTLNWNDHMGFFNAVIYQFDKTSNEVKMVTNHYQQQNDDLQDIYNGKILSKLTFDSGYKQLWVYDTASDPKTMVAVSDTWTPKNEDILGAHYRADGTIEFFRMYQRYIFDGTSTVAQGDSLSWYRSHEEALQVVNGRMAWLDSTDGLHVSGADVDLDLGTIGYPVNYKLTDNEIYYSSGLESKKYDFAAKTTTTYSFVVTDVLDNIVVGEDYNGDIWYQNETSGRKIKVGYGSDAVISDSMHVYWRGTDNNVYEATMSLNAMAGTSEISAVKVSGDSRVYLVLDGTAYWIKNEKMYFTWFNSWGNVATVSASTFNSYKQGGEANYAPGTRMKLAGDPKVYMVGSDGKLHWLTTQLIAYNIYGQDWNKGIVEINMADITQLLFGTSVMSEGDVQKI